MIKRRLVGGILSLVVACWELFMAYYYYQSYHQLYLYLGGSTTDVEPSVISMLKMYKGLSILYSFHAVLALVVGIIFLATCKKQPVKWFEYTLFGVMFVHFVFVMMPGIFDRASNADTWLLAFTAIIQFFCYLLGAPGAKGFKDFPFKSKEDAHSEKSIDKLNKLKELLDSGAITQEEFDQEKKKIWK